MLGSINFAQRDDKPTSNDLGKIRPPGGVPRIPGGSGNPIPEECPLKISATEGWNVVQRKSAMIQAEFALPKAEGDVRDGRLTVVKAGGSIDANIRRWRHQFEELKEKPVEEIDERRKHS